MTDSEDPFGEKTDEELALEFRSLISDIVDGEVDIDTDEELAASVKESLPELSDEDVARVIRENYQNEQNDEQEDT